MSPILILGLAAVALASGGRKKSSSSSNGGGGGGGGGGGASPRPTSGVKGGFKQRPGLRKTWGVCQPPEGWDKGTSAAIGSDGSCFVFWDENTPSVVKSHLDEKIKSMSQAEIEEACLPSVKDETPGSDRYLRPPAAEELSRSIIAEMYPALRDLDYSKLEEPDSPYWLKKDPYFPRVVDQAVFDTVRRLLCGYERIT